MSHTGPLMESWGSLSGAGCICVSRVIRRVADLGLVRTPLRRAAATLSGGLGSLVE